ncbi:hypothetical protein [Streptomyces sp. G-G2]|uniref:hypothetical protein n=1 Tax=Streptomyces sp. G-G2 TaxID=3046201 RepID=UPI0024BB2D60|nr:hypothetical protein [Streptomyces sp. G-G2]MDJ0382566.1 hypothetical protein [Streptomyces sp. G-G2]
MSTEGDPGPGGGLDAGPDGGPYAGLDAGPDGAGLVEALGGWRRDAALLCLLPVFWWPAVAGCALVRPRVAGALMLVVLLSPAVLGMRELYVARRARTALRGPARWRPYRITVRRSGIGPPVLLLGEGQWVVAPGLLGRRLVPARPWPPGSAPETVLWLAEEPGGPGGPEADRGPGPGRVAGARCLVWAPGSGRLGRVRVRRVRVRRGGTA